MKRRGDLREILEMAFQRPACHSEAGGDIPNPDRAVAVCLDKIAGPAVEGAGSLRRGGAGLGVFQRLHEQSKSSQSPSGTISAGVLIEFRQQAVEGPIPGLKPKVFDQTSAVRQESVSLESVEVGAVEANPLLSPTGRREGIFFPLKFEK